MPISESQKKAVRKYNAKTYDRMEIISMKGKKEILKAHAAARGESLNGFVNRCIDEGLERDKATKNIANETNTWESKLATILTDSEEERLNISDFPRSNLSREIL
ncbi:MAG: hypothetical protein FWG64_01420 [Firmicutes bacterium]|nr:hypothetical protein [Bacillota bacterium]